MEDFLSKYQVTDLDVQYHQELIRFKKLVLISDALCTLMYSVCFIFLMKTSIFSVLSPATHSTVAGFQHKSQGEKNVRVMWVKLNENIPRRDDDGVGLAPPQPWCLFQTSLRQQEKAREEYAAGCQEVEHGPFNTALLRCLSLKSGIICFKTDSYIFFLNDQKS